MKAKVANPKQIDEEILIKSHSDGETWGLTMIKEDDVYLYLTAGDDNKLLLHDINAKKVIGEGVVRP